jgi:hypothetical protein
MACAHRHLTVALTMVLCSTTLVGCKPATSRSTLSVTVGSRAVKAVIDSGAGITSKDDQAVVMFRNHNVTVAKDRVLLDGAKVADIPAGAKQVLLEVNNGVLKIQADGATATSVNVK